MLDNLIDTEQFNEWVEHFLNSAAKEKDDVMLWEFFLHKVQDKSFVEFKNELSVTTRSGAMDEAKKEEIIKSSSDILNNFNPEPKVERG